MNKAMSKKNSCISIYPTHQATEQALEDLQKAGLDLKQVFIASKVYRSDAYPIGFYNVGESRCYWECDVQTNLKRTANAVINGGFSAFGVMLYNMGIPRSCIKQYEQAVMLGQNLLIVHGDSDIVEQACKILHSESQQVTVHRA